MNQIYVGRSVSDPYKGVVFEYHKTPTYESHGPITSVDGNSRDYQNGKRFDYVIGPFKTHEGAKFMAENGYLNPNCQTVKDAERLARKVKV